MGPGMCAVTPAPAMTYLRAGLPSPRHQVAHALNRRFGTVHATALNMINMMGIGPFITIPLLMSALGGPQAMLGRVAAAAHVAADGRLWGELGAALAGSGGSFR